MFSHNALTDMYACSSPPFSARTHTHTTFLFTLHPPLPKKCFTVFLFEMSRRAVENNNYGDDDDADDGGDVSGGG